MQINHHYFNSLDSTQNRAREFLDAEEATPFIIIAHEQTQGYGRQSRIWISPPGNFYASLVMYADVPPARYGEYSFLMAVALLSTVIKFTDGAVALKWPNDVLLNRRKCAGVLIESHGTQNEFLIIGIGVNLRHAPPDDDVRTPATALWPGVPEDSERDKKFATALIENFMQWHERYQQHGFEIIRREWLAHAYRLEQQITVHTPDGNHAGIFTGMDAQGNLLLTQGAQIRKINTADVAL